MLSKSCSKHNSLIQTSQFTKLGTLSPDTITITSSGYSTGGSSVLTTVVPSSKNSSYSSVIHNQKKVKSNTFHNFIIKLKNLVITPKTKLSHKKKSQDMSSIIDNHRNLIVDNHLIVSTSTANDEKSYRFLNHGHTLIKSDWNNKCYINKEANFEKISAWLDHSNITSPRIENDKSSFENEGIQDKIMKLFPVENEHQINMKKGSSLIRLPKRSTSMVSTITRPVIEQRTVSPASSFSSSILVRGMSERMTPQNLPHQSRTNFIDENTNLQVPKSNRRRAIDFTRRRTLAGPAEQINNLNKENIISNHRQQTYRFSPSTSNNFSTKKYYFHMNPSKPNEDILMNSYGLTILQQRQPTTSIRKTPQISEKSTQNSIFQRQFNNRSSIQLIQTQNLSDSFDDLLCDREVESYFYPDRKQSPIVRPQHVYINVEPKATYYQTTHFVHGTLC